MDKHDFHTGWLFHKGGGTALEGMMGNAFEAVPVTLPHDAAIYERRNPELFMGNCTGYYPYETVHYTKTFQIGNEKKGKAVFIEFEGIYMNTSVYVNNCFVGKHVNGYTGFWLDITPYIHFGSDNTIKVVVRNGVPSSRWYTGTGIYRNVNLYYATSVHIAPNGVSISTPQVEDDLAIVCVNTKIHNRNYSVCDLFVKYVIRDPAGNIITQAHTPITMMPDETKNSYTKMEINEPLLWNVGMSHLYSCETLLECGSEIVDRSVVRFGIRSLKLDTKNGLRINNVKTKLRGGCIHHDLGIVGSIDLRMLEERRIRKLQKAGYNAIRCAHFPASKTLLEVCDEVGMLVMNEFADAWTNTKVDFDYSAFSEECWEKDVEAMVASSINHPCVIMYSIGNEISECGNKFDVQFGKKIADKIRKLDPSRYITNGFNLPLSVIDQIPVMAAKEGLIPTKNGQPTEINTLLNDGMALIAHLMATKTAGEALDEACSHVDIVGHNHATYRYAIDSKNYPHRVMVGTETYPGVLDANWAMVQKLPQLIGDFSWTAWDYLGEAGIGGISYGHPASLMYGNYPWKSAYVGDFDLIGDRRPISFWREIVWGLRKQPYIAVQDPKHFGESQNPTRWGWTDAERSWNWQGFEGQPVIIEVYAQADELELFRNGELVGRKTVGTEKQYIARFQTKYIPGSLEVIAYQNGKETGRDVLRTASGSVGIEISCSDKTLVAGGRDFVCIEVSVVDQSGILHTEMEVPISVTTEGPISIQGFGSANPRSEENYFDTTVTTFRGRALLVVRSGMTTGKARIHLSSSVGDATNELTIQ